MKSEDKKSRNRVRNFTSLTEYEAGKSNEGDVIIDELWGRQLRRVLHHGEWHFSLVDIIAALTDSSDPNGYWRNTKMRLLKKEGASKAVTNCYALLLPTAGGPQKSDCADVETLLRIIQSVPSPKAEPLKLWLAEVGNEWLKFKQQPSKAIDRAIGEYRSKGRSDDWIDHRLQSISARNDITDEWENRKVSPKSFRHITNAMSKEALGMTPKDHSDHKDLSEKDNLRDHMDGTELALTTLSERAATEIIRKHNPEGYKKVKASSVAGASVAGVARKELEKQLGRSILTNENFLTPPEGKID